MRGKGKNTHRTGRTARITPAYAGKRSQGVAALQLGWDHPRVCGEKPHLTPAIDRSKGSPPRMRGKAVPAALPDVTHGITPAYAGKSQSYRQPCSAMWDHPRVCGEKSKPKPGKDRRMESPPRVRGKGVRLPPLHVPAGITPAYAGKRLQNDKGNIYGRDHPRVCGEKCSSVRSASHRRGSPPRVRGKVCDLTIIRVHHGITPAYAGKRLKRSHSIGHFSCILCLFHSVLHRASVSGGSRAGPRAPPCLPAQNTVPV